MQNNIFSDEQIPEAPKYKVLARKYRPTNFDDLIGQEVLVKTLTNAIDSGRIAHAFVLTGIRGVGKTTTARIIAKALNCIGSQANGKPTTSPCGECEQCKSISEDRNHDVIEMDAASNTGVNDVREIIENVKYKPVSSRFKVYIIDEVHMLSNSAFNALLKTLEEPPEHVKFIFATTEIRKIPITILSRCQRFDLRRVDVAELSQHYKKVTEKEGYKISDEALKLISKAASGSVRDGLSILDQAISLSEGEVSDSLVRQMLGLQNSEEIFKLFDNLVANDVNQALAMAKDMYQKGADPVLIVQDLLESNHIITKLKVSETVLTELPETEAEIARDISAKIDLAILSRIWMTLTKGMAEIKTSMLPFEALEMLLIRLCYIANLPSMEELLQKQPQEIKDKKKVDSNDRVINLSSMHDIISLLEKNNKMMLIHHLRVDVGFVGIEGKNILLNFSENCPNSFRDELSKALSQLTNDNWNVISSNQEVKSIKAQEADITKEKHDNLKKHELVKEALNAFPGSEVDKIEINKKGK